MKSVIIICAGLLIINAFMLDKGIKTVVSSHHVVKDEILTKLDN